jgi:hypothetical protein
VYDIYVYMVIRYSREQLLQFRKNETNGQLRLSNEDIQAIKRYKLNRIKRGRRGGLKEKDRQYHQNSKELINKIGASREKHESKPTYAQITARHVYTAKTIISNILSKDKLLIESKHGNPSMQIPSNYYNQHKSYRKQHANREATKHNAKITYHSKSYQVNSNGQNGWKQIPSNKAISKTENSGYTYSTPTHNHYEILRHYMPIHNYYGQSEDTGTDNIEHTPLYPRDTPNSTNTTKLYKINNNHNINTRPKHTRWDISSIIRSKTIRRTRWDISPATKARSTANRINNQHRERSAENRLDNEYKDLTSDYTDKINKSSSLTNTRWDLSPYDKARIIANRLIAEHLTNVNSNLSQMTNNSNFHSISNATKKKPRPHQGQKHRPKDLIKKLNKKDQLKIGFINTQSALHKVLTIKDYILEHDLDILYIAESNIIYC